MVNPTTVHMGKSMGPCEPYREYNIDRGPIYFAVVLFYYPIPSTQSSEYLPYLSLSLSSLCIAGSAGPASWQERDGGRGSHIRRQQKSVGLFQYLIFTMWTYQQGSAIVGQILWRFKEKSVCTLITVIYRYWKALIKHGDNIKQWIIQWK
jgi:hypothetical protein